MSFAFYPQVMALSLPQVVVVVDKIPVEGLAVALLSSPMSSFIKGTLLLSGAQQFKDAVEGLVQFSYRKFEINKTILSYGWTTLIEPTSMKLC